MMLRKQIKMVLIAFTFMVLIGCKGDDSSTTNPQENTLIIQESDPVTDYDGNVYKTVKIGDQIWMAENLKSTHYSDGTPIQYFNYNNDEANAAVYGRLYRWNASMRSAASSNSVPSGVQGAAPAGWHIPSDNEWQILIDRLGGNNSAGGKMKEIGTEHWITPNAGATNESKLKVLPSGWFDFTGEFRKLGEWTFLRSSTYSSNTAWVRVLKSEATSAFTGTLHPDDAIPIRCIKNH